MASPLIGPIIIGAVGTAVATFFQNNSARLEAERQLLQSEQETAKGLFKDTARLIDRLTFNLAESIAEVRAEKVGTGDASDTTWQSYHSAWSGWMEVRTQALAGTRLYFGPLSENRLLRLYTESELLDRSLRELRQDYKPARDKEKIEQFAALLENLRNLSRLLNERQLSMMQARQVGVFRDKSNDPDEEGMDLFDERLQLVPLSSALQRHAS